jgi:hypothetical protein
MPRPAPDLIRELEEKGFRPFIILFNWQSPEDGAAAQKMFTLHETLEKKGIQGGHGWYLAGKRTMVIIGWTDSNVRLQELCLSVTYGTGINAEVCYAIDVHELASLMKTAAIKGP